MVLAESEFQVTHLCDFFRIFNGALIVPEQVRHLRLAAEVEIPGLVAHPVLVVDGFSGLDAQQHIVGLGVLLPEVVCVIGAHHGDARLLMEPQDTLVHDGLVPDTVVLKLQIKVVRSEDFAHLQSVVFCVFILPVPQHPGNFARQTRGQGDQPLAVLFQQRQINAGLDVKALRPGHGHHVAEVPVTLLVLTQQHQMAALSVELVDLLKPGASLWGDVDLAADDGLDALRLTSPVKVNDAVHDAVVRDGAGGLPQVLHDPGQVLDAAGTVQQAVFRMDM